MTATHTPRTESEVAALMHIIRHRRSFGVKELLPDPIPRHHLDQMLDAANWAPSHGKTEPWRFSVYLGEGRRALADAFAKSYDAITPPDKRQDEARAFAAQRALLAPVWISVGMSPEVDAKGKWKMPEWEERAAVVMAVHNMQLMATALGYGMKWSSGAVSVSDVMTEFVGLRLPAVLLGFAYVGRPAVDWPDGARKPVHHKVTWVENES